MEKELKILMLEDLEEDAGLIDRMLKKEKILNTRLRVDTRDEFIAALRNYEPDLVLSDHSLPQFNSIEALKICKHERPSIPFILVTGAVSEEFAVSCLKQGADDYVLKSNLSRLPLAIRHALKQRRLENDRQMQEIILQKQNKELSKVNSELDSFVYSVSHNLRAPLSSILGIINITKLDKERTEYTTDFYLQLIERSVLQLDDTIKEILDYSRNARNDLDVKPIDLAKLIDKCIGHLRYLDGADEVRKDIVLLGGPVIYTDEYRLNVALTNVISNALKYQDKGKETRVVKVMARITDELIEIVITDNGIGIRPSLLPRVFDMFYRANESSQGAGLGLYITKEVMEKIGGELSLSSVLYEGTTVSLKLPNMARSRNPGNEKISTAEASRLSPG